MPRKTSKIFSKAVHQAKPAAKPGAKPGSKSGPKAGPGTKLLGASVAEDKMMKITFKNKRSQCFGANSKMTRMDAYIWARTAGESDGRILTRGTFDKCLLSHSLDCESSCGLIVNPPCTCSGPAVQQADPYGGHYGGHAHYPGYPPNMYHQPMYPQPAYGG